MENSSPNLSLQLTIHKLNGSNYLEWAQSVRLAIDGRGKLGHLTGEIPRPAADDPSLKVWRSENSLIIAWLINSMEPAIGKPHLFLLTVRDVWEAVRDMYSDVENSSQIFDLKTRLWKAKQGDRDVTTYYNELVTLWQELDLCYEDEWDCQKDSVWYKKREENDRVYVFLAGLNQELDEVRGRILGRKPLPSIREVFSEVRREESRRRVMLKTQEPKNSPDIENSALVSRGPDSEENRKKKNLGVIIVRNIGIPGRLAGNFMGGHRTRRRRSGERAEHYKLWARILRGNQSTQRYTPSQRNS